MFIAIDGMPKNSSDSVWQSTKCFGLGRKVPSLRSRPLVRVEEGGSAARTLWDRVHNLMMSLALRYLADILSHPISPFFNDGCET